MPAVRLARRSRIMVGWNLNDRAGAFIAYLAHRAVRREMKATLQLLGLGLSLVGAAALATSGTVTYQYDDAGRLVRGVYSGGVVRDYILDAAGNRTSTTTSTGVQMSSFSIGNVSVNENAGAATVTITKTGSTVLTHGVSYATADGTAVAGTDYSSVSGTLSFAPSEFVKTFTVPLIDNSVYAGNRTFTLSLDTPTNGSTITTGSATATINENEAAPAFSINSVSANEALFIPPSTHIPGVLTFTITKSTVATAFTHTVNWATSNGTATAGSDYTAASGTLTFAPSETSKTVSVTLIDNFVYEGNETLTVNLSAPSNGATISTGTGTGTIIEDDPTPPPGTLAFTASSASVNESGGSVTLQVSRTGGNFGAVSITCSAANATATAPSDYTATSAVLSWIDGDAATKSCSIPIVDDAIMERTPLVIQPGIFLPTETFTAALSGPSGGVTVGTPNSVTVTITDNDDVVFSIVNATVDEGAGSAAVTVTKTGGTSATHVVNYSTANGSAVAGSDYSTASGFLSFAVSDTTKTFTVPIANDSVYEGNETFTTSLSAPSGGATLGTSSATVTITDNDSPPAFAINNVSSSEIGIWLGGTTYIPPFLTFTVSMTAASSGFTHMVSYATANGTATAGSDYTATSGTLSFAPGETSKGVVVSITDDAAFEGNETLTVNLSSPSNGATISTGTGTGTIIENDPPPPPGTLAFTTFGASVNEGAGSVTMQVSRTGGSYGTVSLTCSTANGNATSPLDYGAINTVLTWANGDTANKSCTVSIVNDTLKEFTFLPGSQQPLPFETFSMNLSGVTGGAILGSPATASITIMDND